MPLAKLHKASWKPPNLVSMYWINVLKLQHQGNKYLGVDPVASGDRSNTCRNVLLRVWLQLTAVGRRRRKKTEASPRYWHHRPSRTNSVEQSSWSRIDPLLYVLAKLTYCWRIQPLITAHVNSADAYQMPGILLAPPRQGLHQRICAAIILILTNAQSCEDHHI